MLPPRNLAKLHPRHRLRKAALLLEEVERKLRGNDPTEAKAAADYGRSLAAFLAADGEGPEIVRKAAALVEVAPLQADSDPALLRAINGLRHILLRESGQAPADWDLLDPLTGRPDQASRRVHPGMRAWLEDIRSPFNVGSMLRSADAFGLDELLLSAGTADPRHSRALRSSMGAVDIVPWRRAGAEELQELAEGGSIFALELGGTPLRDFHFPETGIVIVGSEELGVSADVLGICGLGKVSIPMAGAKASLNAGVAFGILMSAWAESLDSVTKIVLKKEE